MKKRTKLILTALIAAVLLVTTGFLPGGDSTLLEKIKTATSNTAAQLFGAGDGDEDEDASNSGSASLLADSTSLSISQNKCNFTDSSATSYATLTYKLAAKKYSGQEAYSTLNTYIKLWHTVKVSTDFTSDVRTVISFVKWDDRGLEINTSSNYYKYNKLMLLRTTGDVSNQLGYTSFSVYYVGRKDGWGQTTDAATDAIMNATHLENASAQGLVFFSSLDTLKASEYTCVGAMIIAQYEEGKYNPSTVSEKYFPEFCYPLLTTSDTDLLNTVYDAMADSIVSSVELTDATLLTEYSGITGAYEFNGTYDTTNEEGTIVNQHNLEYTRAVYTDGVMKLTNSNTSAGHSVLICGEVASNTITITNPSSTIDDTSSGSGASDDTEEEEEEEEEEETATYVFDLDKGENTVELTVQPTLTRLTELLSGEPTTTVYVKVTLPAGTSYISGSAKYGDTSLTDADNFTVTTNAKGTTTLLLTLENVTVEDVDKEKALSALTLSCEITAVTNGKNLTIISETYSTYDTRLRKNGYFTNYATATFQIASTTAKYSAEIVWDDNSNQDGVRPTDAITLTLTAETASGAELTDWGQTIEVTDTSKDSTTVEFGELLLSYKSVAVTYTITTSYEGDTNYEYKGPSSTTDDTTGDTVYTFTYSHTPETRDIDFTIIWVDDDNLEGFRPDKVTVKLTVSGDISETTTATADESSSWGGSFTNLDKYSGGTEVAYGVDADIDGYAVEYTGDMANGFTITATRVTSYKEVTVNVVWEDSNNVASLRPESVEVSFTGSTASGVATTVDPITIIKSTDDSANTSSPWSSTASLPLYTNGQEITYSTPSASDVKYYYAAVTGDETKGYTITYTLLETTITLGGTKTATNYANSTNSFAFNLYQTESANTTSTVLSTTNVSSAGGSYSFASITYNEAGTYYYIIEEVSGSVKGWTYDTNVYYVTVEITQDGSTLSAAVSYTTTTNKTATSVTASNDVYSFADFTNEKAAATAAEVTVTATKEITGADALNSDLDFSLYKDGSTKAEDTVTLEGSDTAITSNATITFDALTFTEDEIGNTYTYTIKETTTTAPSGWSYSDAELTFTVTVSFDEATNSVVATINEVDYTGKTYNAGSFTNTYSASPVTVTLTATAEFVDATNSASAPAFAYYLYSATSDGTISGEKALDTQTTNTTTTSTITFSNEDLTFKTTGTYYYLVKASTENAAWTTETSQYLVTIKVSDNGAGNLVATIGNTKYTGTSDNNTYNVGTFTNTYATTSVAATVKWDDASNQDGVRPDSVTVTVLANGESTTTTADVSGDGNEWTYTFENLPVYDEDGYEIKYTVSAELDDTTSKYYNGTDGDPSGNQTEGYVFTYSHTTYSKEITVTVTWDDNDNQDGMRPKKVSIDLLKNGDSYYILSLAETAEDTTATLVLASISDTAETSNTWTYTFTDLSVYASGAEITYSINPADVDEYTIKSCEEDDDGNFAVIYTHVTETVNVTVTKVWDDGDDQDGVRSDEIDIVLSGSDGTKEECTLSESNDWTYTFTVPKYYNRREYVTYIINEISVDGYTCETVGPTTVYDDEENITGYTFIITNTHVPATQNIIVSTSWDDDSNRDGARASEITATITGSDGNTYTVTMTSDSSWAEVLTNLPVYMNGGKDIEYTIEVTSTDDAYTFTTDVSESGYVFTITASHTPATTEITVTNTWVNEDDADGLRGVLVLTLIASDGTEYTGTLAKTDSSYTFTVFTYGDGDVLDYELVVSSLDGYTITAEVSDSGFVLTSTHTVATTTEATTTEATTEATTGDATTTEATTTEVTTEATNEATTTEASSDEATTTEATTEATTATSAKTGDEVPLAIAFAMMLMGIAGAVVTGKKRGRK